METLPCSTSFLMSVNFDGLKEVIDFLHKNINILNDKINDLNKKFQGFEELKSEINENKNKTDSSLRLLNELDERITNISQNITKNTEKSNSNEEKIKKLDEDIVKLEININNNSNNNVSDSQKENLNTGLMNKLFENYKELREEVQIENNNNKDNIDKLNQKINGLEQKVDTISTNKDINNDINNFNNININDNQQKPTPNNISNEDNANNSGESDNNKIYELLSKRIDTLEQNVNKLYIKENNKNYNEIYPSNNEKPTIIKEISVNNAKKDIESISDSELKEKLNKKINEFSEKIIKLEDDIRNIQLYNSKNININMPQLPEMSKSTIENILNNDENKEDKNKNNEIKEEESKEENSKDNSINKHIAEIISQINEINNKLSSNDSIKKTDFNKYVQKIDIQFKDYNDKINKIIQKDNLRNKMIEDMSKNINKSNFNQNAESIDKSEKKNTNNNYVTYDMFQSFESHSKELIIKYISNIDISANPSILEIHKNLGDFKNQVNDLSTKMGEIIVTNNKNNEYNNGIIDNIKKETKNNLKKIENEIERITSLQEEIDFFRVFLLGKDEDIKYKNMTQEEKKNELLIGTSIKEEMTIHGNYLKKLSEGLNKVNSRINNLNKETLVLIKKDLKSESNIILEDFKSGLKDSINRIETQLRDKVDKLGLDEFWNKINEQLIAEMKEKIDKKEMNKNNQYLKRKIDNLEGKISRTLVDTLIDLQMDEAPLMVKRNFREITEKKCASCGQNLPNINSGMMSNSSDFNSLGGISQYKIFKPRNINDKDKLPEIKQTIPK